MVCGVRGDKESSDRIPVETQTRSILLALIPRRQNSRPQSADRKANEASLFSQPGVVSDDPCSPRALNPFLLISKFHRVGRGGVNNKDAKGSRRRAEPACPSSPVLLRVFALSLFIPSVKSMEAVDRGREDAPLPRLSTRRRETKWSREGSVDFVTWRRIRGSGWRC